MTCMIDKDHERHFWLNNRQALLTLGREATDIHQRGLLNKSGCVAAIMAYIEAGEDTRDVIIPRVPRHHNCSYRQVAFILDKMTGDDPEQHLWFRGEDRRYRLHNAKLKMAA